MVKVNSCGKPAHTKRRHMKPEQELPPLINLPAFYFKMIVGYSLA